MRIIVVLTSALLTACGTVLQAPQRPLVCSVSEAREAYAGQVVTLTGQLVTDFHHSSGITNVACPDAYVPIGHSLPGLRGGREFDEAWFAARACADDPLFFSVTGRIEAHQDRGRSYLVISPSEFFDIRRGSNSTCPMTLRELYSRQEKRNDPRDPQPAS